MREENLQRARILVVDDEPQNVRYLQDVLQWAGYEQVEGVTDPLEVLPRFRSVRPDLIVLDLLMPELDGFGVMEAIAEELEPETYLPILILTSDISREARRRALAAGAKDFLTKPMSPTEVRFRVANLLQTRFLYLECERQRLALEAGASEAGEGGEAQAELLEAWAAALDTTAGAPDGHAKRVAWLAAKLASSLGLPDAEVELIRGAALLHDLGAMAALGGPGREGARLAPQLGIEQAEAAGRILEGCRLPVLRLARDVALASHERWDGAGRPDGVTGEAIPLAARIVAVADRFDLLCAGPEGPRAEAVALAELEEEAGTRYDPAVVEALGRSLGAPVG